MYLKTRTTVHLIHCYTWRVRGERKYSKQQMAGGIVLSHGVLLEEKSQNTQFVQFLLGAEYLTVPVRGKENNLVLPKYTNPIKGLGFTM